MTSFIGLIFEDSHNQIIFEDHPILTFYETGTMGDSFVRKNYNNTKNGKMKFLILDFNFNFF